jgi:hypothetical protein
LVYSCGYVQQSFKKLFKLLKAIETSVDIANFRVSFKLSGGCQVEFYRGITGILQRPLEYCLALQGDMSKIFGDLWSA